jgi:hypothetical protein
MRRHRTLVKLAVVVVAGALVLGATRVLAGTDKPEITDLTVKVSTVAPPTLDVSWTEKGLTKDNTNVDGKVEYSAPSIVKETFNCPDPEDPKETVKVARSVHRAGAFLSKAFDPMTGKIKTHVTNVPVLVIAMPKGCDLTALTVKDITLIDLTNNVKAKAHPSSVTFL